MQSATEKVYLVSGSWVVTLIVLRVAVGVVRSYFHMAYFLAGPIVAFLLVIVGWLSSF